LQDLFQAFVLALVQGITEFLPISSSAHLILIPKFLHWPDQGLAFDVALHVGTLCAVIVYFRTELKLMIKDWFAHLLGKRQTKNSHLAWAIGFGTIPVGLAGLAFNNFISQNLRATWIIAITTLVFGILMGVAVYYAKEKRNEYSLTWKDILLIGCAQAIALIPGVSRSGITLTAGLFRGLTSQAAARFSFLLSIPVILLSGGLEAYKLSQSAMPINYQPLMLGFVVAGLSGYACIGIFLKLIARFGLMPFVQYRIALALLLLLGLWY
jgi:undecaprenyl-diphosphatase